MEYLTFALAKGRLAQQAVLIFDKLGFDCSEMKSDTRKLIFTDEQNKLKFFLSKAEDVPTYVEYGAADIGIVGKDTLLEENRNLCEVADLGVGECKVVIAGYEHMRERLYTNQGLRVSTKYPRITREHFRSKHRTVEIIKLNGSVELGPVVGLSDVIVDIVETGSTLKANGLVILDEICRISARLVVNRVSMKLEHERIGKIINMVKGMALCSK